MTTFNLPKWIEPVGDFELIRLGRDRDGGYLVDSRDLREAEALISLGVNDDWSFEQDFLRHRPVMLHAFDGTIDQKVLAKRFIKSIATRKYVKHQFRAFSEYGSFFSGPRVHHKVMVGFSAMPGFLTLKEIIQKYGPAEGRIFFKIDIEGYEYRLLDDILAAADRISGLVIEFHNVDLHRSRIEEFVASLPLSVAHVHPNGFAPVSDDGLPITLEVTFSSHDPISNTRLELPHPLDRPSAPYHENGWKIRFGS